ncbi:cobyrinate a,c-diamide synthase [bacterium]|nr:MAG: cobyrinate a,c-diamide synthase [bacterium]
MDSRPLSAVVIGGTHSGVGKTTITLGMIGALRRRGLTVQPFKVGPDFIDPLHHGHAAGRPSRNLDGWMLSADTNRQRFAAATADADAVVIEGVMGLYDGSEGKSDRGSAAEMAKLLDLPVILVVDAGAMARSAAALIHGYVSFDPAVRVVGVILNNVGGAAHANMIRDAVGDSIAILGALPRVADLVIPERHLGLYLPHEGRQDFVEQAANLLEAHIDIDQLLRMTRIERRRAPLPAAQPEPRVRIGVARDEAFCFYYADNLELLAQAGAQLVEFSPIRDPMPSNLDGLYIGGGYPELHAQELAENSDATTAIREFAASGGPIYAECGGLMYLAEQLRLGDEVYPLCGILPFSTTMPGRLKLAYVEVETTGGLFGGGRSARGHVFHRSEISGDQPVARCYQTRTSRGEQGEEGYHHRNVLASYIHLHFASDPGLAVALVDRCEAFRSGAHALIS